MNEVASQIVQNIQKIAAQYQKQAENLRAVLTTISALIAQKFQENFHEQGRWDGSTSNITIFSGGNQRWAVASPRTLKAYEHAKPRYSRVGTLINSGRLKQSISVVPLGNTSIQATASVPYAAIHQLGGDIDIPAHERSSKWKASKNKATGNYKYRFAKKNAKGNNVIERKYKVNAFKIHIKPRPFFTLTPEDVQEIVAMSSEFLLSGK